MAEALDGVVMTITICRLKEIADPADVLSGIDDVFFTTTERVEFESPAARHAFRDLWLGQYLHHDPDWVYVALQIAGQATHEKTGETARRTVVGYLVGSPADPAQDHRFANLGYFQDFAEVTKQFPAQLHVNVNACAQGQGVGSKLIDAFVADLTAKACPGVHAVTRHGHRNVAFYQRNGLTEQARTTWNDRDLVFLGRAL